MSNFKRILSLALTMLMVLGCFAAVASVSAFKDVTEYEKEIDALYDLGIVEGKDAEGTTYAPDEDVTRWQMALLIAKMMTGKVDNAYVNWYSTENFTPFTDVNADQFYGSMSYAHNMGVIRGTTDTTFNPTGKITYQDALTMLVRALGYGSDAMDAGYPWTFIDKAIYLGVDDGMPAELNYGDALTRGEVAKLLYNTLYADRYNDIHSHDSAMYTTFAYDVFGYYAADVTVMVVAAEGDRISAQLQTALGGALDFSEYERLITAKVGSYYGFVVIEAGPEYDEYFNSEDVLVLPASEFGVETPSRLDLGKCYNVVFSDYYFGNDVTGIKSFDKCTALAADIFEKGEFAAANTANTSNIETLTIDGTKYYTVTDPTNHLSNGDRNTAYNNDEIIVFNGNSATNALVADAATMTNDFERLAAFDIDGDGDYDYAQYYTFDQARAWDQSGNYSYLRFKGENPMKAYYTEAYYPMYNTAAGLAVSTYAFYDLEGKPVTITDGAFYRYSTVEYDEISGTYAEHRCAYVIVDKVTTTTATGLVTGVDLYNKTVTLDSIDANNPGTLYNVGSAARCTVADLATNGDFAFGTDLLGRRVTLVMDETSAVIAINDATIAPPTPDAGVEYIFIRDTGRDITVGNAKYPIVALYDSKADILYAVIEEGLVDTIVAGDNVKLFAKESGYYKIEEFDPAYVAFNPADTMTEFGFIDQNTAGGYYDFTNAKILVFTGTTFVEYDGVELGAGTWFDTDSAKIVCKANGDQSYTVSFAYFKLAAVADYNVTAKAASSTSLSSIVYVGAGGYFADKYSYINYDGIGTHNANTYEVTFYAALDMITGETRTVTFKGYNGEKLPVGCYYVDKNGELRQQYDAVNDTYTMVSANSEMTYNVAMDLSKFEINANGQTRYGKKMMYVAVTADGFASNTGATDFGKYAQDATFMQPAGFVGVATNAVAYVGSNYGSDVLVVITASGM